MIQIFRVTIAVPPNHSRVVGYYSDERLAHKEGCANGHIQDFSVFPETVYEPADFTEEVIKARKLELIKKKLSPEEIELLGL